MSHCTASVARLSTVGMVYYTLSYRKRDKSAAPDIDQITLKVTEIILKGAHSCSLHWCTFTQFSIYIEWEQISA